LSTNNNIAWHGSMLFANQSVSDKIFWRTLAGAPD
jgi:hypothetical protein